MKYLSRSEESRLLKSIRRVRGAKASRDAVIVELALHTGLRAQELQGLKVGDVRNKEKLWVHPEDAKRGHGRFITLSHYTQRMIRSFIKLKLKNGEAIRDDSPLFVSRRGGPLSKRSLQEAVDGWMVEAGLFTIKGGRKKAVYSIHSLRHTYAMRKREGGVRLETIQKLLGHASMATTAVYMEPDLEELEEAAEVY